MSMCVGVGKPVYRGHQMIASKAGSSFGVPWMELRLPGRVAPILLAIPPCSLSTWDTISKFIDN